MKREIFVRKQKWKIAKKKEKIQVSQEEQSHTAKRKGKYHRLCIGVLHFSLWKFFIHSFCWFYSRICSECIKLCLIKIKVKKKKLAGFLCYEAYKKYCCRKKEKRKRENIVILLCIRTNFLFILFSSNSLLQFHHQFKNPSEIFK